jgi:16S rRNA G966 N2-methylase RsmD
MLFLDPPYASNFAEATLAALTRRSILAPQGVVIWQHAVRHEVPSTVLGLLQRKSRRYGETQLSLYTASWDTQESLSSGGIEGEDPRG